MIKDCNPKSIQEVIDLLREKRISFLEVKEFNGDYVMDFTATDKEVESKVDISFYANAIVVLEKFKSNLESRTVKKFTFKFSPLEATSIINSAYDPKGPVEVEKVEPDKSLRDFAESMLSIVKELKIENKSVKGLFFKPSKQYQQASLGMILAKIIDSVD